MASATLSVETLRYSIAQLPVVPFNFYKALLSHKPRSTQETALPDEAFQRTYFPEKNSTWNLACFMTRLVELQPKRTRANWFQGRRAQEQALSYWTGAREAERLEDDERGSGRLALVTSPGSRRKSNAKVTDINSVTTLPFRMIAIGSRQAIMDNIKALHHLGYAEAIEWSKLQPGGKPGTFISILTIRGTRGH